MTEVRDEVVAGSNPVIPTITKPHECAVFLSFRDFNPQEKTGRKEIMRYDIRQRI
jgi:hypothetical protein